MTFNSTCSLAAAPLLLALLWACDEKPAGPPPSRFASVQKPAATDRAKSFCDLTYEGREYQAAPTRALEGSPKKKPEGGWRWVNAWATWCTPCVEEMGLLSRWRDALKRDGVPVSFELLSIDTEDAEPELKKWLTRNLPGEVKWLRSEADFEPWLDGLGVDRAAAIPIHALVDPKGQLRCVRVGAVHEQDYGAVRSLLERT